MFFMLKTQNSSKKNSQLHLEKQTNQELFQMTSKSSQNLLLHPDTKIFSWWFLWNLKLDEVVRVITKTTVKGNKKELSPFLSCGCAPLSQAKWQ